MLKDGHDSPATLAKYHHDYRARIPLLILTTFDTRTLAKAVVTGQPGCPCVASDAQSFRRVMAKSLKLVSVPYVVLGGGPHGRRRGALKLHQIISAVPQLKIVVEIGGDEYRAERAHGSGVRFLLGMKPKVFRHVRIILTADGRGAFYRIGNAGKTDIPSAFNGNPFALRGELENADVVVRWRTRFRNHALFALVAGDFGAMLREHFTTRFLVAVALGAVRRSARGNLDRARRGR